MTVPKLRNHALIYSLTQMLITRVKMYLKTSAILRMIILNNLMFHSMKIQKFVVKAFHNSMKMKVIQCQVCHEALPHRITKT